MKNDIVQLQVPITLNREEAYKVCETGLWCSMEKAGYAWAVAAGLNAALAAIFAKLIATQIFRYGLVIVFNVIMWGCFANSLKALSSLQATVTNFATNFLTSGLAGYFLFEEALSFQWLTGAVLIVIGVLILSKSSTERKFEEDGTTRKKMH
ncbi:uncharacterized protein LOC107420381 [Ziziphus jujuba]|uniref:Uncharacterized protein LOC107420381 n=1 Tax=Ziziphus jujuba TaxID=326968 RepID=A0A6P4AGE3_ZIZJJ|nr:uncharacterized protein LOC107420381 [Ziziphus jujuba]